MLPDLYRPELPPFQHQREALEAGWDKEGFGYLLEMGLGKSRVTIDNFCLLFLTHQVDAILVIAPKSVYTNWTRWDDDNPGEFQKWLWPELRKEFAMYAYKAGRVRQDAVQRKAVMEKMAPGPRILAMNVEAISSTEEAFNFAYDFIASHRTLVVIDESTVIKNPTSIRTKKCIRLAAKAKFRRILTGSPSTGSLADLWSQFEFLGPGRSLLGHRLFATFRARYCVLKEMHLPGRPLPVKVEVGSQNVEELAEIVAEHSFRRRKKDCLDLLPKVYLPREVELTDEQKRAYSELRKHAMTLVRNSRTGEDEEVTTSIVITQLMRMHQVVCGHIRTDDGNILPLETNRIKVMMEVISEYDDQVVIWCMYRPDADRVVAELKKAFGDDKVAEWHGGVTQAEREAGEADFQAGRRRFMVATKAGARGRTWTAAQLVIYYANDHDLEIREQSEDRTHRIGTTGTVVYVDLIAKDTVDEKIITALRNKKNIAGAVMREGIEAWI